MNELSREAFNRARQYIMTRGRVLDQNLFACTFEGGGFKGVLAALKAYQNPDGGFGHALEPDLRASASSAIATQQAFNYLRAVDASASEPLVITGIKYLLKTFDTELGVWPIIPPEVEEAPHAPWWSYADSAANFDGFWANPTAALAGHLHHYASLVPAVFLIKVTNQLLSHLAEQPDDEMNMHDLLCYLTLAENLTGVKRRIVLDKLSRVVPGSVETDRSKWAEYTLRPLAIASAPDSPLVSALDRSAIEADLDYEIEEQLEDGSWPLAWSWDFVDEAAWNLAEREWKGFHALRKLKVFKAYGRLEWR
jgi:hypothetical protein